MSSGCVMPVGVNALADVSLRNPCCLRKLLQEGSVQLRFIKSDSDAPRDLNRWLVDFEPFVLLYLFDPVAQVWVRHQNVKNQVLHVFREGMRQLEVSFQDLLVETLSVLVLEW